MPDADLHREDELAALIVAAQAGEAAAFRELVGRYQPYLVRLARRRLRSGAVGQQPSDLVQDTLERAVRCLRQFQGRTDPALRRWLAVIMNNILIQQHRAARRQRRAAELLPLPSSDQLIGLDPPPRLSETLRVREAWRALLREVFALPSAQREAVHLYLRGEAVADIAQTLGRTPAAVSCLLQRGGQTLQTALGEHGQLGLWLQTMRVLLAEAD